MPKIGGQASTVKVSASGGVVVGSGLTTSTQKGTWQSSGLTEVGKPLKVSGSVTSTTTGSAGKMKIKLVK